MPAKKKAPPNPLARKVRKLLGVVESLELQLTESESARKTWAEKCTALQAQVSESQESQAELAALREAIESQVAERQVHGRTTLEVFEQSIRPELEQLRGFVLNRGLDKIHGPQPLTVADSAHAQRFTREVAR